jgi:hypothetical protein
MGAPLNSAQLCVREAKIGEEFRGEPEKIVDYFICARISPKTKLSAMALLLIAKPIVSSFETRFSILNPWLLTLEKP